MLLAVVCMFAFSAVMGFVFYVCFFLGSSEYNNQQINCSIDAYRHIHRELHKRYADKFRCFFVDYSVALCRYCSEFYAVCSYTHTVVNRGALTQSEFYGGVFSSRVSFDAMAAINTP